MTDTKLPTNTSADQTKEAAIQQVNLGYNVEQDRLLFKIGLSDNTELLVWLTNRITKMIWQLLNNETSLPSATSIDANAAPQQAVAQFKQELQAVQTLQKLDFKTEYQPRQVMRNDGALLATNAITIATENNKKTLEMVCYEGMTVRINLNQELILAVCNMLQLACKEAGWSLGVALTLQNPAPITVVNNEIKVLH